MWLEKISLRNIKSFEKANLTFSPRINIIIGHNNSGKSTIIRLIDRLQGNNHSVEGFVRNGQTLASAAFTFRGEGRTNYFSNELSSEIMNGAFVEYLPGDLNTAVLLANREKQHLAQSFHHEGTIELFKDLASLPMDKEGQLRHEMLVNMRSFPDAEPDNVMYASYSNRGFYDTQINEENSHQIRQDLRNLPARLHLLNFNSHPNHKKFNRACQSILGFIPNALPQGKSNNGFSIGVLTDTMSTIHINNMGQGVLQVLGLLSILFTQEKKIILLEEIENDLHPAALKQLLVIIAEQAKDNQFIISTHSNIVLKHLGSLVETKIFQTSWSMKRNDGKSLPFSSVKEISNTPQDRLKVLTDMGYDLIDFELWQGYILFEESTAERIVRDYLIPVFFPSLGHKVRTIAAQGVNDLEPRFKDFLRLFVFIHLSSAYMHKAWVIVDGDDAGKKVRDSLVKKFPDWDKSHFISLTQKDFELYYPKRFTQYSEKVLSMPHGQKKQEAKGNLLREVIDWTREKPAEAKREFETSAKEVIDILRSIDRSLKQ